MKRSLQLLVTVAAGLFSATAYADNCDQARNTFDEFYCKDKLYLQADKDLNTAYGALMRALNANDKRTLKSVQLAWIRERDSQCIGEQDGEIVLYVNCRLNKTIEQTQFLQARVRECQSTGCQPSRLTLE